MTKRLIFLVPVALVLSLFTASSAQAQDEEELPPGMQSALDPELASGYVFEEDQDRGPSQPPRVIITLGAGASLRLVQNFDFVQDRFAPAYLDVFGAFVFGGRGVFRHGAGLGLSMNLSGDGNQAVGVDGFEQIVLAPAYLAYLRLSDDFTASGKLAIPLGISPSFTPGVELSGAFTLLLLAGFGPYVELGFSTYFGGEDSVHPLIHGELGLAFDYELLP